MPWELTVLGPNGGLRSSVTNESHRSPVMSIEASVDAGGRTNTLVIRARNIAISALPRSIIEYKAWSNFQVAHEGRRLTHEGRPVSWRDNYEPLAAGVVVTSPPLSSPGAGPVDRDADALERITAVGLEKLLQERIVKPRAWQGDIDVGVIAYELCAAFAHPMIVVKPENFPSTGHALGLFYTPEKTVSEALDDLANALPAGGRWYVDARREIHFRAGA